MLLLSVAAVAKGLRHQLSLHAPKVTYMTNLIYHIKASN